MSIKSLTQQKLQMALSENKAYSGVQPYIQAIASEDLELLNQIINPVLVQTLASDKASLMSKLLVLRMYKDLFLIGNMEMFDEIDSAVQQAIISAAAYNPKFRPKGKSDKQTRGGMYFIQLQKRQKTTQSLQLGNSFVLFSTQIIKFFASWLPQYPDNQQSRFLEAYQELQELGVEFNTNIYFQEEQKNKFLKNHQKWRQKRIQKQKKQKFQPCNQHRSKQNIPQQKDKFKKQEISSHSILEIKQSQKNKCLQIQSAKNREIQEQIKKNRQNLQKIVTLQQQILLKKSQQQKYKKESQIKNHQILNLSKQIEKLNHQIEQERKKKQSDYVLQKQLANFKQQMKKLYEEKIMLIESNKKLIDRIQQLQGKINQLSNTNNIINKQISVLHLQNQALKTKELNINQNQQKNNIQEQKKNRQMLQILNKQKTQKLIEKDKFIQSLFLKIKQLQLSLQQNNKIYQERDKITNKDNQINDEEKHNLTKQIMIHINYQQLCSTINNSIKLKKQQCNILNKATRQQNFSIQHPYSNLIFQKQNKTQNKYSLHKTQSSKFRQIFSHTRQKKKTPLKQSKIMNYSFPQKEQNQLYENKVTFYQENRQYQKNIVTLVFPFIQQYFSNIPITANKHFRASCISKQARKKPFYYNCFAEFRICQDKNQPNGRVYSLLIKNIHSSPISVKLTSQNQQIKVRKSSNLFFKVGSFEEMRIQIQSRVTNLNFRFPLFNVNIQQDFSNLFKENTAQLSFKLPIPLTLISFTQLTQKQRQLNEFERFHENTYKRHRSQQLSLNSQIKNLPSIFPQLVFYKLKSYNLEASAILSYPCIPEIKIKLVIIQNKNLCQFYTQFFTNSKISQAFSKVILQALMFACG